MKTALTMFVSMFIVAATLCSHAAEPIFEDGAGPVQVLDQGAGEGPAWLPQQGLFFSGPPGITQLHLDGHTSVYRPDSGTNGLYFDDQRRLLACESEQRRFTRTDADGTISVLAERFQGERFNTPNDFAVDSRGRIFFSDPRYGDRADMEMFDADGRAIEGVYRIDNDGTVTRVITHEVDRPNGLLITPDNKYLYIADNNNNTIGGAHKLWRFDLQADGSIDLTSRHLMFDWGDNRGPDGLTMDSAGRLYVAAGRTEANPPFEAVDKYTGGVYVLSPQGQLLAFAPVPNDEVTNCEFGDPDLRTLYITAGGTLWKIRTITAGATLGRSSP